jgi:hypothetical protein
LEITAQIFVACLKKKGHTFLFEIPVETSNKATKEKKKKL